MDVSNFHPRFTVSPDIALERLIEGNERFLQKQTRMPILQTRLLDEQSGGQQPYATILGCSDSRVPPELIFDAWLGELFVIRVAGNVVGPAIFGTLQYATRYLHTPLYVILGHEGCGAVDAALNYRLEGKHQAEQIQVLLEEIVPSFESLDYEVERDALLACAVEANVKQTVHRLTVSEEGQAQLALGAKLVGAVYDIRTGKVRFL